LWKLRRAVSCVAFSGSLAFVDVDSHILKRNGSDPYILFPHRIEHVKHAFMFKGTRVLPAAAAAEDLRLWYAVLLGSATERAASGEELAVTADRNSQGIATVVFTFIPVVEGRSRLVADQQYRTGWGCLGYRRGKPEATRRWLDPCG